MATTFCDVQVLSKKSFDTIMAGAAILPSTACAVLLPPCCCPVLPDLPAYPASNLPPRATSLGHADWPEYMPRIQAVAIKRAAANQKNKSDPAGEPAKKAEFAVARKKGGNRFKAAAKGEKKKKKKEEEGGCRKGDQVIGVRANAAENAGSVFFIA